MKRDVLVDEIQNYNDKLGSKFLKSVEDYTASYKQGVIHHEEYIKQVETCCIQAKELLLPLPEVMETSLDV